MEAPRRAESLAVAGYVPRRRAPDGRSDETGEREELRSLLREATRLIESADFCGASDRGARLPPLRRSVG